MKPSRNTSPGSQSSSSRKPASRGKSAKQKRSTSEKISKYFTKDESAANITPPYSNVKAIRKITASDDDDFKSPIVAKKLAPVFTKAAKKRTTKTTAKCGESRTTRQETVNEEHLRLALALSISSQEGSSEFVEKVPVYPSTQEVRNNAKRTLEQYGFHSSKEHTARSNLSDEIKRSKKSRFKYITPTLLLRTEEDRANKISTKISTVLNEFTHVKEEQLSNETLLLYSEELQKYLSKNRLYSAQSAPLSNDRDVANFYVANLSLSPCTAKCGSQLKRWECIPGRDKSPVKEEPQSDLVKPVSLKRSRSPDLFESDDELFAKNPSEHAEGKLIETSCIIGEGVGNVISFRASTCSKSENVEDGIKSNSDKLFTENSGAKLEIIDLSQSSDSNADELFCTTSTEKRATLSSVNFIIEKYLNSSEELCSGDNRTDEETNLKKLDLHGTSLSCEVRLSNCHQINSSPFNNFVNLESFSISDKVFNDIDVNDTSLNYRANHSSSVQANIPLFHNKSNKGKKSNVVHINFDVHENLTELNRTSPASFDKSTKIFTGIDGNRTNIDAHETSLINSVRTDTSLFDNSSDKENFSENGAVDNKVDPHGNSLNYKAIRASPHSSFTGIDVISFDAHGASLSNFNGTNISLFDNSSDKEIFSVNDKIDVQETNCGANLSSSIPKSAPSLDKSDKSFLDLIHHNFDAHGESPNNSNRINTSLFNNSSDKDKISENGAVDDIQETNYEANLSSPIPVSAPSLDKTNKSFFEADKFDTHRVSLSNSNRTNTSSNSSDKEFFSENGALDSNFNVQDSSPNYEANQGSSIPVSPPSIDKSSKSFLEVDLIHNNFDAYGASLSDSIGISTTFFNNFIDTQNFPENSVIHNKSVDRRSGSSGRENLAKIDNFNVSGTNQSYEENMNNSFQTNLRNSPECAPKNALSKCNEVLEISSDSDISDDEIANLSQKATSFTANYVVEPERGSCHLSASSLDSSESQESIIISDEELNYSCIHSTPAKTANHPSEECTPQKNTLPRKILHPRIQQLSSKKAVFEDTFGKMLEQNSLSDLIETPQKNTESEAIVTPNGNLVVKTTNVTPMPAYESMDTPEVVRELSKYGVKKLKRRRGVELLKYIYESTHPSLEACDNGKEDDCRLAKRRRKLDLSEDCGGEEKRVDIIGDELIVAENDVILEKKKSKKILSCPVPLHIAWHNLLMTDRQLQENVLLYEPLQVEVLHGMLKDQGLNYHVQDLISFLDKKCITIRTGQNQGGRRKRY